MNQHIEDFYNHYHTKVKSSPNLYQSKSAVDVILPGSLLHYANAAAGHTGFGSGARARGIRRETNNPTIYIQYIFSSPSNLEKFLEESEKDAEEYVSGVRRKHSSNDNLVKQIRRVSDKEAKEAVKNAMDQYGKLTLPKIGKIVKALLRLKAIDQATLQLEADELVKAGAATS